MNAYYQFKQNMMCMAMCCCIASDSRIIREYGHAVFCRVLP